AQGQRHHGEQPRTSQRQPSSVGYGHRPRAESLSPSGLPALSGDLRRRGAGVARKVVVASLLATTPDKIVANGGAFVGTPQDVADQIRGCVDAFGPIEPSMQINFGGSTDREAFRTLELFASKVMSKFK